MESWIVKEDWPTVSQVLKNFQQACDAALYVQETAGVLPGDIPSVYENAVRESQGGHSSKLSQATTLSMALATQLATQVYEACLPGMPGGRRN